MSKLAEFKALEAQLAAQLQQLDAMKNDSGLKQEIEYGMNLRRSSPFSTRPRAQA